jgi:hypothetical protein
MGTPSAKTSRNNGKTSFIEPMAGFLDVFALFQWRELEAIAAVTL